jgi:hypothetical protein
MAFGESFEFRRAAQAKNDEQKWVNESVKNPRDRYREVVAEIDRLNNEVNSRIEKLGPGAAMKGSEGNTKNLQTIIELEKVKKQLEIDYKLTPDDLEEEGSSLENTLQ